MPSLEHIIGYGSLTHIIQAAVSSSITTYAQPRWHLNVTFLICRQWSAIIDDTVKTYCLSEKLISKHVSNNPDTNYLTKPGT